MTTESLLTGTENTDASTTATAEATATATAAADATTTQQAGTDQTTAEGTPAAAAAAEGAPETYTDFTLPEGQEVAPALIEDVKGLAKDLNLTQDKAQKVADFAAKTAKAHIDTQTATIQALNNDWISQTKADKEMLAGPGLEANLATAQAAMLATTNAQFQTLLKNSGLGNHPDVIRHFLKIAPAFAADKTLPNGKAPAGAEKTAAKVLYPSAA